MSEKTIAILKLFEIEQNYKAVIVNGESFFYNFLSEIAKDIFEGYTTYYAVESCICELVNKEVMSNSDCEKYLHYIKDMLVTFYSNIKIEHIQDSE